MRILIVGAGAMGSLYGAMMYKNGLNVTLVDIAADHIRSVNSNGLKVTRESGEENIRIPAFFANDLSGIFDLVMVFTKSYHTKDAISSVEHLIGEKTILMTLQNGLGNIERLNQFVCEERIIAGITNFPCDLIAPGVIESLGTGKTLINNANGVRNSIVSDVCDLINDSGLNCNIEDNILKVIWEKVAFNAALNSVTAVTNQKVGCVASLRAGNDLVRRILDEVISLAKARGILVDSDTIYSNIRMAFNFHKDHMPSMLQDVKNKKKTENDSINGELIKVADEMGFAIPTIQTMHDLISIIELNY